MKDEVSAKDKFLNVKWMQWLWCYKLYNLQHTW